MVRSKSFILGGTAAAIHPLIEEVCISVEHKKYTQNVNLTNGRSQSYIYITINIYAIFASRVQKKCGIMQLFHTALIVLELM